MWKHFLLHGHQEGAEVVVAEVVAVEAGVVVVVVAVVAEARKLRPILRQASVN